MTNIVVLIKQVPDTYSERKLSDGDYTLDREAADAVLDEINEKAVEEALKIKEADGGEVTVLTVGPDRATDAIRKALSMGADKAIHVKDDQMHGSDAGSHFSEFRNHSVQVVHSRHEVVTHHPESIRSAMFHGCFTPKLLF